MFFHKLYPLLKTLQVLQSFRVHSFALYFEFAESGGRIGKPKHLRQKKRAGPLSAIRLLPDDHPQPYKMRNIGCPVLSHYTVMLHFCQHILKKNTKFLKKIDSDKTVYFFVL